MHYSLFETALGTCGLGWSELGVVCMQLPGVDAGDTQRRLTRRTAATAHTPPPAMAQLILRLQTYMRGEAVEFGEVVVDLSQADPLCRQVYAAARAIAWGRTVSYGEMAGGLGMPNAAREVGQALARSAVPVVIPCHRIVGSDGKLGGYSAPGGPDTKLKLLELEGARPGTPAGQGALF
ncbi:MAG: methylated-DNA-[protein]-cysteine S-methyltransferase protein [Betaproteobacteria bacterium]|nr:methylated-DNA-[protein]-cysteine S-methyltransferase protein [Betaproteobacteria bacterium]